ncbi:uncharacterized protein [Drosophila virilis]|uniref:uncharacterized protein isoform X2 n=1 Tax=Drosophila virilis TaxID=7244 RepID=UPI0038B2D75D
MHNIRQPQERLLLVLMICACACSSTSARPSEVKLQSQYLRAISAYRRLERSLPPQELRALIGLGLLNGARQTNEQMEQHLVQAVKELIQTDKWQSDKVLPKIDAIEQQMERDQYALNILSNAMDVLCNDKNEQEFRQEVYNVFKEQQHFLGQQSEVQPEVGTRLGQLRCHILQQFSQMKTHLDAKIERTLDHLVRQATVDGPLAKASHKILHKRAANEKQTPETPTQDSEKTLVIKADLPEDDFRQNLVVDQSEKSGESGNQTHPKNEFDSLDNVDPEDEGPPQPLTFTKNFLSSFLESKFRPAEAPEERHGSGELPRQKKKESLSAGFNSEGFVQQIASHLVSSVLGLLLNASLGASGGASHASTGVFSSSSHHTKT